MGYGFANQEDSGGVFGALVGIVGGWPVSTGSVRYLLLIKGGCHCSDNKSNLVSGHNAVPVILQAQKLDEITSLRTRAECVIWRAFREYLMSS